MLEDKHIEKELLQKIGKQIRKIRMSRNLRQNEIAYRCNFDKSSYHNIETGKRNVTLLTLNKIANALEIELKELFDF